MNRAAVLFVVAVAFSRSAAAAPITEVHYVMGTYLRIDTESADPAAAREVLRWCFGDARRLESRFSRFDADSELSRINASTASALVLGDEMAELLRRADQLRTLTAGAFDVASGALTALWREATTWPERSAVQQAQHNCGSGAFFVDGAILRRRSGVRLDLDGIAKGFAVDRCAAHLRQSRLGAALISLGESSLYALGAPAGKPAWEVMIRSPDGHSVVGNLRLRDQALSASAVFGHEHRIGNRRVGHIVDPRRGVPLTTPALAVVVASRATDAEAWSKAVLVDGNLDGFIAATSRDADAGALFVRKGRIDKTAHILFTASSPGLSTVSLQESLR